MRTPGAWGHLLPVAVPGFIVIGALSILVMPTVIGQLAFNGPVVFLIVGLLTGTLVLGYLVAGLQTWLAGNSKAWALPPEAHLASTGRAITLPAQAVQRAGFSTTDGQVTMPLGHAFALERALAGAWGTPEGAGWDRLAFVQRIAMAMSLSALLALTFMSVAAITGGMSRGLRDHGGSVLVLGAITGWILTRLISRMRQEAVVELLADARALLLDRGENTEVQRVLTDVGLRLEEEELGVGV